MQGSSSKHRDNIFPEILYVIDREATMAWKLNDTINFHNLMLIYEGRAQFECNGMRFEASKGDLVYYKPGDVRRAHTFPESHMKCFAVDFLFTCPVYMDGQWTLIDMELPFSNVQKIEDEYLYSRLQDLFSLLTKSSLSEISTGKIREKSILTEILVHLFRHKEGNQYNYSSMRKVDKVINYMAENYRSSITLRTLADYAQISPSYLGNIFKKVTGKSTIDYLIEIRLNKAKALLSDGVTVSETSKLAGFNDIFYFSKCFKKHEGMSPTQYLEIYRTEH